MSNRIDFFQSVQTQMALPASSVSILVGGKLCPFLEPMEIVRGGWPEFSWARLAYNRAAYDGADPNLRWENMFASGRSIMVSRRARQLLHYHFLRGK
ncbi:MAG: hypothetical protein ACYSUY_20690 [Planctomycetota bacterium]